MRRAFVAAAALLVSAAIVGGIWVGASLVNFPLSKVSFDRGALLFQQRCASCHSDDPARPSPFGPDLSAIGGLAASRISGLSAEEFLVQSIVDPAAYAVPGESSVMPVGVSAGLDPEEVISIAGYLATRGGTPDRGRLLALVDHVVVPPPVITANIDFVAVEAGRKLFLGKGNCIDCHLLRELPGNRLRAPSVLGSGNHTREHLLECINDPGKHISTGYEMWNATLTSGKTVSGRILRRDAESIALMPMTPKSGGVVTVPLSEIDTDDEGRPLLVATARSSMPRDWQRVLTEQEIELIVTFLRSLK